MGQGWEGNLEIIKVLRLPSKSNDGKVQSEIEF